MELNFEILAPPVSEQLCKKTNFPQEEFKMFDKDIVQANRLYLRGLLCDEEIERVRNRLLGKVDKKVSELTKRSLSNLKKLLK